MLQWLMKLIFWWRKSPDWEIHNYGRYVHKLNIQRCLSMVIGITQGEVNYLVNKDSGIYINGDLIDGSHLVTRLTSGRYEVKVPSKHKIWIFFIA